MSRKGRARVDGIPALERALLRVASVMRNPVLREAVSEAAEPVREDAERLAPVGETGELSGGMTKVSMKGTPERAAERVGPSEDAWYGFFQEVGTMHHDAQPFLRPALDMNRAKSVGIVRRRLRAELLSKVRIG